MAVYIGVDLLVRTEPVCWMNTADGEIHQHTLDHSRDDLRAFYAQFTAPAVVGIESSGYALWFHQLMEQAGHRLLVGRSEEHTSELQSQSNLVCRLLLEKKKNKTKKKMRTRGNDRRCIQ